MFLRRMFISLLAIFLPAFMYAQEAGDLEGLDDFPELLDGDANDELAVQDEGEQVLDRIIFRDLALDQVLAFLERLTGRSVIRPQQLPSAAITFDSQRPLTVNEAILATETLLSINGITVVPLGEYFLKVIPAAQTQQHAPELIMDPALNLSPSGRVVSRLFQLEFLQIEEFSQRIQPILTPQIGTMIPFEKANSILITETVSNMQRIETILAAVDRPVSTALETRFFNIRFAQAQELVSRLTNLTQTALQREFSSSTVILAEERTNQVIVITDPRNMEFFEEFIERVDIETDPRTRNEVIQLKHADAEEVASLLSQLVSQQLGQTTQQTRPAPNGRPARPQPTEPAPGTPDNGEAPPQPEAETIPPEIQAIAEDMVEEMASEFSSLLTILADERTNSLVVSGTVNDINLIEALVSKIDVLLAQVYIEVVIAEVSLSRDRARGIDSFGFEYTRGGDAEFGFGAPGVDGRGFQFGFAGTLTDYTIDGVIGIAQSKSEIDILSVPSISTTHNREARIIVGEARPIVTSSVQDTGVTGFRSQVQFRDIGIELTVTPLIGIDGVIQLEIEQLVDNVVDQVEVGGNLQPVIGRKEATSFVSVADGDMVVLGGLQSEEARETHRRMAILGSIPLVGRLFSPTRVESQKTELLIFIRPTVLPAIEDTRLHARQLIGTMSQRDRINELMEQRAEPRPARGHDPLIPAQRSSRVYD